MDEFNEIIRKLDYLEKNKISLATICSEYGFSKKKLVKDNNTTERYQVFKASKKAGHYKIIIIIETRDSYKSFANDKEPYFNIIELWKDGRIVDSKNYTYFK